MFHLDKIKQQLHLVAKEKWEDVQDHLIVQLALIVVDVNIVTVEVLVVFALVVAEEQTLGLQ